jgi:rhamnosyltransferase
MATFNGRRWIEPQVDSILGQEDVDVTLTVSDDGSDDGTCEYLEARAMSDPRVAVLPSRGGRPGVTANFLYLFTRHPITQDCYVAFSDQDDIWRGDKLRRQVAILQCAGVDAVSSNVVSFDESGHRRVVVKSAPQTRWDYIFEAAGPGSTYVFTPSIHSRLVKELSGLDTAGVAVHDWFLYALVRALDGRWLIDDEPVVSYRQHESNVQGEHHGISAFRARFAGLNSGFYRRQFLLIAETCRKVGGPFHDAIWDEDLSRLIEELRCPSIASRFRIARRFREMRRDRLEGIELAAACLLGVW